MPWPHRASSRPLLFLFTAGALTSAACGVSSDGSVSEGDPSTDTPTFDPIVDDESNDDGQGNTRERVDRLIGGSNLAPVTDVMAGTPGLTLGANTVQSGYTGDLVTWKDSANTTRTAFLVNPGADPSGAFGAYLRTLTYVQSGATRTLNPSAGEPGFGFVYSQRTGDWAVISSKYVAGTRTIKSQGPNHLTIEYAWASLKTSAGAAVPCKATVQWTFVVGRDYPIWDVTYDASASAANALDMDSKSPYGGLEFTGQTGTTTDGVGWGDRRKFVTTSAPLSMNSAWSYTATNVVPYVYAWNTARAAEMGLVQTERYTRHDGGYGNAYTNWGKTSATKITDGGWPAGQTMPANWNWTYLLNQYQLPDSTKKVVGWGMNFGSVGKSSVTAYGGSGTFSGYPYQSYGVALVNGARNSVTSQVAQTERLTNASVTATRGAVVTSGVAGVGRTDTKAYSPVGYNPITSTFDISAEATTGAAVFAFDPKSTSIKNPVFRIVNYPLTTEPTGVRMGSTNLVDNTDYVVSRDGTTLWFVLKKTVSAVTTIGMNESAPPPPPPGWGDLAIDQAQNVGGFTSDVVRWRDSGNKERSVALVRNNALDPAGFYGGYVRQFKYVKGDGSTLTATGGHVANHPGWGYTLHHQQNGADRDTLSSRRAPGTYRQVFVGKHHAIHEFSWNVLRTQGEPPTYPQVDKNIKVTIRWMFANGKDAPTWAHTLDASGIAVNTFNADDRSPAGELAFDGSNTGVVSGAGWGDRYRFKTTSAPLSMNSTWDYTQTNRVPYTQLWSDPLDAEQGSVQTWDWQRRDAGYGWLYPNWGRTSANKVVSDGAPATQNMPADWNWTYQLNQYEISYDSASKRMQWGTNFGIVGQANYSGYGDDRSVSGYPYTQRTIRMAMGAKGATLAEVDQVTRSLDVALTATEGTVATSGPKGFGAAAGTTETFVPAGWNHVYGVFELVAAANNGGVRFTMAPNGGTISKPVFRIRSFTQAVPATISASGATLTNNTDYLASIVTNEGAPELWLTLLRDLSSSTEIAIAPTGQPPPPPSDFADINHILGTGQSNSVFSGGHPVLTTTQPYNNKAFNVGVFPGTTCDGNGCKSYQTPTSFIPLVEGDTMFDAVETMSSGMANQITRAARILLAGNAAPQNDYVSLVSIHGRSGRTYQCLRKSGCWLQPTYINPFTEGMLSVQWGKQLAQAQGKTYNARAVTVIHGESDHYGWEYPLTGSDGTPNKIQNYADAMVEWQQDYDAGIKAITGQTNDVPLLMAQMHSWSGDSRTTSRIPTDQYDAMIRAPQKVVIVAPEYMLKYDSSGIHFDSPSGRRLGEYFAKVYTKMVIEKQPWEPVRPKTVARTNNVITITYHVPVPPLALDTTQVSNPGNYGFEYTDGSASPPTITNVQVIAPDQVRITLSATPTGANKRVRYAYTSRPNTTPGAMTGVRGCLRDSDATPSLYGYALQNWGITYDLASP